MRGSRSAAAHRDDLLFRETIRSVKRLPKIGLATLTNSLVPKQLEMLHELVGRFSGQTEEADC
jgi:hypothetical protein